MICLQSPNVRNVATRYRQHRFVVLPQLLQAGEAEALLTTTARIPAKEVICGDVQVSWHQQNFTCGMPIFEFFRSAIPFIDAVLKGTAVTRLTSWSSIYTVGKHINPHMDKSGTIQLLLCLAAPPACNGGSLHLLEANNVETTICLQPGDGLLFEARKLLHWTTPLIATTEWHEPQRVVVVGRYFTSRD